MGTKPRLQSLDDLALGGAPTFTNASLPEFKMARGGFAGAAIDAEAARNLLSRAEQDAQPLPA